MRFFVIFFIALFVFIIPAQAQTTGGRGLTPRKPLSVMPAPSVPVRDHEVNEIEGYINTIGSYRAAFTQVPLNGPQKGKGVTGRIYMLRPGKLRVEYDPPNDVLIIGSPSNIVYYDAKANQFSHIDASRTPLAFLMRHPFKLDDQLKIMNFKKEAMQSTLSVIKKNDPASGKIDLIFDRHPARLKEWIITDAQGTRIQVKLFHVKRDAYSEKEKKEWFVFKNPRLYKQQGFTRTPKWY